MITLSNLSPNVGATRNKKRIGRGPGSGHGKTSGKGHKGAKARSGGGVKPGFEGGQMPLQRRVPKRGFRNKFKIYYTIINLHQLNVFSEGCSVDKKSLFENGLIKSLTESVKILSSGVIDRKLNIKIDKCSNMARLAIESAGGTIEVD